MRVYVYVDGFNLYYRALKNTRYKWLNLVALAERQLKRNDNVALLRYFTARVGARAGDPDAPRRQQIFFNAIGSLENVQFHYGRFLSKTKIRPLVSNPKQDGWHGRYDAALVLSQDTDLVEPIRIVVQELGLRVGLVWLDGGRPNPNLAQVGSFVRHIKQADLVAAQFPNPITMKDGSALYKPPSW